jgi:type IV secretion system protein VirD4
LIPLGQPIQGWVLRAGSSSSWEHSSRSAHRSTSRQQIARRLIKPEEVLQGMRYDEQIIFIQNAPPLRCGRAIYFRRPEMVARTSRNRNGNAGG